MTEVFAAAACTGVLGVSAWLIFLGNRVTRLEANDSNRDVVMSEVKTGVVNINAKLDAFILTMVNPQKGRE